jgi:hypothetical protein
MKGWCFDMSGKSHLLKKAESMYAKKGGAYTHPSEGKCSKLGQFENCRKEMGLEFCYWGEHQRGLSQSDIDVFHKDNVSEMWGFTKSHTIHANFKADHGK